jgi:hypothetical protein
MVSAVFDAIPTAEAIEYDGDIPSAFARLPAFSPSLVELRDLRQEPVRPTLGSRLMALWAQPNPKPPAIEVPRMAGPDPEDLERFQVLMAEDRWSVDVPRMLLERKYAYDRILLAYTSPSLELLALAQHLFKVFQARSGSR